MTMLLNRRTLVGAFGAIAVLAGAAFPAAALAPGFVAYKPEVLEQAIKSGKPVLIHVHADWCPTCKKQEAAFNELNGNADFKKFALINVNFDMDTDFRKAYGVNNQSILIVIKGGKEVARVGGVTDKTKIAEFLAAAVK